MVLGGVASCMKEILIVGHTEMKACMPFLSRAVDASALSTASCGYLRLRVGCTFNLLATVQNGVLMEISDGGKSLSVGQRQLLSLARALLQRSRVLLMDEATSNVDTATDSIIQSSVRSVFADCTVLTVAHRLHTVMDSDQLLVFDSGLLVENGSPQELLSVTGKFRMLVDEAGSSSS